MVLVLFQISTSSNVCPEIRYFYNATSKRCEKLLSTTEAGDVCEDSGPEVLPCPCREGENEKRHIDDIVCVHRINRERLYDYK